MVLQFPSSTVLFAVLAFGVNENLLCQTADPLSLLKKADHFADLYNWADAGPIYEQAEQMFNAAGDVRNALYAKIGRLRGSMESSSLPELSGYLGTQLESKAVQNDSQLRLRCVEVKGDVDGEIDTAAAVRDWTQVLAIAKSSEDRKLAARATGELAILAFLQGRMQDARPMIGKATLEAKALHDVGAEIRYLSASGTALALLQSFTESLQFIDQALALARANPDVGVPFPLYWAKVKALFGLKRLGEAQALIDFALKEAREKDKRVKEAQFLITGSTIAEAQGNHDRAIELLVNAAEISKTGKFRRLEEEADFELADIFRTRGDLMTAETYATSGLQSALESGETYLIPKRISSLAEIKASLRKFSEADELYAQASDVIEGMLLNTPDARTQVSLLTTMSQTYAEHFALAAQLQDSEKAFAIVEQVRGRSLNDLLRGSGPGKWEGQASPADEREISRLRMRLVNAKDAGDRRNILQALFFAGQTRLLNSAAQPETSSHAMEEIPLEKVRSKLRSDEVLLEFVLRNPQSFCLVATRDDARIVQLPGRALLDKEIDADLNSLTTPQGGTTNAAHTLYSELFSKIPEVRLKTRLIVVADGQLHLIPFGSLIDNNGRYLVASRVISYAPSGTSLYLLANEHSERADMRPFLGVGGVDYGRDTQSPASPGTLMASRTRSAGLYGEKVANLPPLPGSEDEVRAVSIMFGGGTTLIGAAATKAAFESQSLDRYRVIHLAVHGVADSKEPDHAALILRDDPATNQDGYLEPGEVARLHLNAELVTLSACETAVGRLQGQEGVANLARAFLYSGAKTVVSTLWRIDDNYSLYLMKHFYQHLAAGRPKADALTLAQRDLIQYFGPKTEPYYWAPFVLVGDPDTPLALSGGRRRMTR